MRARIFGLGRGQAQSRAFGLAAVIVAQKVAELFVAAIESDLGRGLPVAFGVLRDGRQKLRAGERSALGGANERGAPVQVPRFVVAGADKQGAAGRSFVERGDVQGASALFVGLRRIAERKQQPDKLVEPAEGGIHKGAHAVLVLGFGVGARQKRAQALGVSPCGGAHERILLVVFAPRERIAVGQKRQDERGVVFLGGDE